MSRQIDAVLRPGDASPDVVPSRDCGPCTLCCTVLRVDDLKKLGGVACAHLRADSAGCGIYQDRPRICRTYRCLWLQGGLEDDDRPDRLDAVLDLLTEGGTTRLSVRESVPGAADTNPRLREVIAQFRASVPVRISDVRDVMNPDAPFRVLLPGGEEHRLAGDTRTLWRDGVCQSTERLPLLDRVVRRIVHAIRAFRVRNYGRGD